MRHFRWGLGVALLGMLLPSLCEAGRPVRTPRKFEPPATGHWGYVPTWRDRDPNQLNSLERATHNASLRKENKFREFFGDYVFMRPGTEMQYTWDVPSYKRGSW